MEKDKAGEGDGKRRGKAAIVSLFSVTPVMSDNPTSYNSPVKVYTPLVFSIVTELRTITQSILDHFH